MSVCRHFLYTGVNMEAKEQKLRQEYEQLKKKLETPAIYSSKDYPGLAKRQKELDEAIKLFDDQKNLTDQIAEAKKMVDSSDVELTELANSELGQLKEKLSALSSQLSALLIPRDQNDE